MEKYQIVFRAKAQKHAGTKAPLDVSYFAREIGYEPIEFPIEVRTQNVFVKLLDVARLCCVYHSAWKRIPKNCILLFQFPLANYKILRKEFSHSMKKIIKKNVKLITLIHDVDELRPQKSCDDNFEKEQLRFYYRNSVALICHNEVMIDYLASQGFDRSKLIDLKVFDYLHEFNADKKIDFSRKIIIAGCLDPEKVGYLSGLPEIPDAEFDLYGIGFDESIKAKNIEYKGCFKPEELPAKLNTGFGMVWDGDSIETCSGAFGEYLRYNNPHKMSLYLASGLPVIVWKESAVSKFILENNLGIAVDSLKDCGKLLNNISENDYNTLCRNVKGISEKLVSGYFIKSALSEFEKKVELNESSKN